MLLHDSRRAARSSPTQQLILLDDQDRNISRFHALFLLDGWDVQVVDLDSTNGTLVSAPGSESWSRIEPHRPVTLKSGARVKVGDRVLLYDSHHG